jgi:hypothetical protein
MTRVLALAFLLLAASWARGDIPGFGPRPRRPFPQHPANAVPLIIEATANDQSPRLLIPRVLLERAKARKSKGVGSLRGAMPFVAIMALTLCGLCMVGFRGRGRAVALWMLGVFIVGGIGVSVLMAAPPPTPQKMPLPSGIDKSLHMNSVRVEISDQGDTFRLLVPAKRWAEYGKRLP